MDIEQLLKRQEGLADEMAKGLKARGFNAAQLMRPVAATEERAAALRSRIDAIKQEKSDHAAWADSQISALTIELNALNKDIKTAQAMVKPVAQAKKTRSVTASRAKSK